MHLEADRMANLNVTAEEFAKEIKVVMEERRLRTDDKRASLLLRADDRRRLPDPSLPTPDHRLDERSRKHERRRCQGLVRRLVRAEQRLRGGRRRRSSTGSLRARREVLRPAGRSRPAGAQAADRAGAGWHAPGHRQGTGGIAGTGHGLQGAGPARRRQGQGPLCADMLGAILDGHDAARFNKTLVREDKVALSVGIDYDSIARGPA